LTLEEPPSHAVFILATTNIENVPITILSRCQRFDFQKITIENIVDGLKNVANKEQIEIDDDALKEIAYLSEGGMRDALSLLDQLSKNKQKITLDIVENQIKTISQKSIGDLLTSIENNDIENTLERINEYRNRAIDYKTLIKKIIDIASIRAKNIKKTGKYIRLNFNDYKNMVINLSDCLSKINISVNPYTILEMILLEFLDIEVIKNKEDFEKDNLESNEKKEVINNFIDDNLIDIRINNCFVNAQKDFLEQTKTDVEYLSSSVNINGKIKSIIMDSNVVAASDEYIILTCINNHAAENANKLLNDIESLINSELKKKKKLIFISEDRWQKEKKDYILNIKLNKKYEYIPEKEVEESSNDSVINDIFDMSKVEII